MENNRSLNHSLLYSVACLHSCFQVLAALEPSAVMLSVMGISVMGIAAPTLQVGRMKAILDQLLCSTQTEGRGQNFGTRHWGTEALIV